MARNLDRRRSVPLLCAVLGAFALAALQASSSLAFAGSSGMASRNSALVGRHSVAEDVGAKISSSKVFVVSKEWCPFCMRTKTALKKMGAQFEVMELEDANREPLVPDPSAVQDYMEQVTGARTMPRVFVGGKFIGGGTETLEKASSGELEAMLKEIGALS
ncbi:unnamed protein product [Polarella glacialis]|uniref:Glutaredoxin domain-containing protein n=1 Tax=Polarella glacialis TaxID=89957 RepID=A0A813K5X8_POLGL|nr:unnamed protein product [Polarella glacialis]CAE8697984.1 unnamed protein product [Polarella glacialis]|mmetsp:Transcript_32493/g.52277  ORF Transcript_32493/g.52277 Transcript_32493/m.52277 type:complete len:161 (+) Transcript_32493:61-543(+)